VASYIWRDGGRQHSSSWGIKKLSTLPFHAPRLPTFILFGLLPLQSGKENERCKNDGVKNLGERREGLAARGTYMSAGGHTKKVCAAWTL
jgi:hypothetical protein